LGENLPRLRTLRAAGAVAVCALGLIAGAARAAPVKTLSDADAAAYSAAFHAAAQGDFAGAEKAAADVSDKSLVGYLQLQKLTWRETSASYAALKGWLAKYADLPGADRVFQLALKRKPRGASPPAPPTVMIGQGQTDFLPPPSAKGLAAREAYYSGDLKRARRLAMASGERWIAGLAAFRSRDYGDALAQFQAMAHQPGVDDWLKSGAAYWAARAAISNGQPELAPDLLTLAASSPATFYGMLAERQLGLEPGADPDAYALEQAGFDPAPSAGVIKAGYSSLDATGLSQFLQDQPRARRAAALAQVGMMQQAGQELRAGLAAAGSDFERRMWTTLALQLNSSVQVQRRRAHGFDPDDFPTPALAPAGGFTLDKALVYAIVRQETRFNTFAVSTRGAMGLMQVTPDTALTVTGDTRITADPLGLFDAATNLRVGQDYFDMLLKRAAGGDVIKALAAYNAGPGVLLRTEQTVGSDDPLLLMESMPAGQTRVYVENVMASYWIYRRMFGEGGRAQDPLPGSAATADLRQQIARASPAP
jgi:soluble lytic murein transglycosylase-like protein